MSVDDQNKVATDDAAIVQVEDASTGNTLGVTAANEAKVSVTQPLPTGTNSVGQVTANAGTNLNTSTLATSANLTAGTQRTQVTDGTTNSAVKAASTAAVAVDPALVVAISPNNTPILPSGAATSALQTSGNASLTSIDAGIPAALGQTNMSASMPVVLASDQSTITMQGASGSPGTPSGGILTVQGTPGGATLPSAVIDTGNSTSVTLTSGSTFAGTWKDVSGFSNMTLIVFSDQASATDGLVFEFSSDGTNVDDNDMYTVPASSGQQISVPLVAKFIRIRYVNGGTNQGAFRLQAKLHTAYPKGSSQRIGTPVNNEQDAELVLAVIARQDLAPASPTAASVGVASAQAVAANANRKGLTLVNTSSARISIALGATAVLSSGITLFPGGSWEMDVFNFDTGAVNAIASAAASNLAIQEFS